MSEVMFLLPWFLGTVALAWLIKWMIWRAQRRLPPGPTGLPILGYLPFLGPTPFKHFIDLAEKYGKIYGFNLGSQYTVILNDFAHIKEALNKEEFIDRPPSWFRIADDSENVLDMNGKEWKETRKFTVGTLRNLGLGKNKVEETVKEQILAFIEKLDKVKPETEVDIYGDLFLHFWNVMLIITCGSPYKEEGSSLLEVVDNYNFDLISVIIENQQRVYYPFLKPLSMLKYFKRGSGKPAMAGMKHFIRKEIEKHEKNLDENNLDDFVSYYLSEVKKNLGRETSITRDNIMGNTEMLLIAGTDTTRTSLAWVILHLALYQEYQEQIYQQVLEVLGKERPPQWSDKDNIPLINAFLMETARMKPIFPAEDPRWSTKESEIGGYCIPKGTIIIPNIEAVHRDAKLWHDPDVFRPWRYITNEGKAVAPDYWIPFLIGKRSCPGVKLAMMQLFLYVATILQKFRIVPPKSGLNMEEMFRIFRAPVKPFVSFQKRD